MVEETTSENYDFQVLDVAFGGVDERGESLLSPDEQAQNERVMYGNLVLETAPKEGKANILLASALFSPSFFLAEQIEMGLLPVACKSILELGAGAALPSLLLSMLPREKAPSLIVTTDYPDEIILGTLVKNVKRNILLKGGTKASGSDGVVDIIVEGYKWGDNPAHVLRHLRTINSSTSSDTGSSIANSNVQYKGFDILILSDLLHFDSSHGEIMKSIVLMLNKVDDARVYVVAGKYTQRGICESFIKQATAEGLIWEEIDERGLGNPILSAPNSGFDRPSEWRGKLPVRMGKRLLTDEELADRRNNCWGWVGRWGKTKR